MKICYLCQRNLLDENGVSNILDHEEHIIPQSIGGHLTSTGILCKECGGEKHLGGNIDAPFGEMFKLITERLDIRRDRRTNSVSVPARLNVLSSGERIEVNFRDSRLIHRKPGYKIDKANKKVLIFASKPSLKSYREHISNLIKNQFGTDHQFQIEEITDLSDHPDFKGSVEFPFNLDNKTFEAGHLKIALEYALYKRVDFQHLSHLIDKPNRQLKFAGTLTPYFPVFPVEEILEDLRPAMDTNYMSHNLVLFSQRQVNEENREVKQLNCFIELFGTFQHYVVLNDHYTGPDIEPTPYSQLIIKQSTFEEDFSTMDIKDLSISLREFGLDNDENYGKSIEEIIKLLARAQKSRNKYVFDYQSNMKAFVDSVLRSTILHSNENLIPHLEDLVYHFYVNPDTDHFHVTHFRSRYAHEGKLYSIIPEIWELYLNNRQRFHDYTYSKFYDLEAFVNINSK